MKFRTELTPERHPGTINHCEPVLMLGSCFSDNIGEHLSRDLFHVVVNPTGTLYNPESILQATERIVSGVTFDEGDLFCHEGLWHSPFHHSRFSSSSRDQALEAMNAELKEAHELVGTLGTAVITLGSTRVFIDRQSGTTVANCHKLPASRFEERELDIEAVADALEKTVAALRSANPEIKIVLTVSPVRHLASGLVGNSLSKATLRVAIDKVKKLVADTYYFPSYEIMLDDLRDYRFYDSDMKHPSGQAVDYIYEKFTAAMMDDSTRALADECRSLTTRLRHRALGEENETSRSFQLSTLQAASELREHHPYLAPALSRYITI